MAGRQAINSNIEAVILRRDVLGIAGLAVSRIAFGALGTGVTGTGSCAVLIDAASRRLLSSNGLKEAGEWIASPGSTVKPISLWTLLKNRKLGPGEVFSCPRYLRLSGVQMNCSHPQLPYPMDVSRAITYSCNCAVAHFAQRFRGAELPDCYRAFGFDSPSQLVANEGAGNVAFGLTGENLQLQALGERGVEVSTLELASAYARLAALVRDPVFGPVLDGLEGAVAIGTGQAAQVPGLTVAGKTGSVRTGQGLRAAWFAGFAPSRNPEVVVAVLTQGRSGADAAAPIAGDLLRGHFQKTI